MRLSIPSTDGMILHGRRWPAHDPRGVLVIAHGFGEHLGNHDRVARELTALPGLVEVFGLDFRGHGLSPGRRGVVADYRELIHDLRAVVSVASSLRPNLPVFVLGHSNGGQVALRLALEDPGIIAGLVLSSPFLAHAGPVPTWKLAVGRVLERFAPGVTLSAGLGLERLTRDVASYPARRADRLLHDRISAPLYFGMVEGGRVLQERAGEVRPPLLLMLGSEDQVTSVPTSVRFLEGAGSPDKTLRVYPGMRHEPLHELGREQVVADLVAWLDDRLRRHPLRAG